MMNQLITIIIIGFLVACLGNFIFFCFGKGMIFRRYYNLITYYLYYKGNKFTRFIYKPLGGCLYCFTTWLSIIYYFIFSFEIKFGLLNIFYLFLQIGITYISTNIIYNKIYEKGI